MMQRTQIYLPRTQMVRLKEIARCNDTTVSDIIRVFLQKSMTPEKNRAKNTYESLTAAAKRINRLGTKAPRDLAKNLDRYLYGSI